MTKKVLILSTGDIHGAYEAAYRIAKFLFDAGYEVALLVRNKTRRDPFIIQIPSPPIPTKSIPQRILNKVFPVLPVLNHIATDSEYYFLNPDESKEYISADVLLKYLPFVPDLIWVGMTDNFVNTNTLAVLKEHTNARIYLQMMDMEPITGGCHYAWDCKGYENECHNCPAILDKEHKEQAHKNLMLKLANIRNSNIQIIAGSGWTYEQAKRSTLFKNQEKIFNTNSLIDTSLFNNRNRKYAKNIFDIPADSKVIFTGSWFTTERRKGLNYFVDALNYLWEAIDDNLREKVYVMIAGENNSNNEVIDKVPFQKHLIDYIKDYRLLSQAYQASDVFICSSIEDSGPMMVSEALACGTPVVGFEMGVVYNMVQNDFNGYKAKLKDSKDLAIGMRKILTLSKEDFETYSKNAVEQVSRYSSQKIVLDIVREILEDHKS